MRFRKKDEKNFVKVGIFISALTLVLAVMIVSIGKENSVFEAKVDLKARVPSVANLKAGAYVELRGIRVGNVTDTQILSEEEVEISLTILESQLKWIRQDSRVAISTAGLVGDKFLEIFNGTKEAPSFNPETDVLKSEASTDFKQMMSKGESIATVTERIVNRLDLILYNMDEGKKIIATVDALQKTSQNLEVITQELKEAHLGAMSKNISSSMNRLDKILGRVENGPGTLNSMIYDDGLHDDLRALLGGASRNKVMKYFIRESIKNSERKKPKTD